MVRPFVKETSVLQGDRLRLNTQLEKSERERRVCAQVSERDSGGRRERNRVGGQREGERERGRGTQREKWWLVLYMHTTIPSLSLRDSRKKGPMWSVSSSSAGS